MSSSVAPETTIESQQVFDGKLLKVFRDIVRLPNGHTTIREYIKHPGAAVVIPYLGNRQIVMLKQFRYPVRKTMLELPAGKIDPGESPIETIQREIMEEINYRAKRWHEIGKIHTCVGYSDELIYIYWAWNLEPCSADQDEDENLEPFITTIDDAIASVLNGEITDAKTMIGLFFADRIINGGFLENILKI